MREKWGCESDASTTSGARIGKSMDAQRQNDTAVLTLRAALSETKDGLQEKGIGSRSSAKCATVGYCWSLYNPTPTVPPSTALRIEGHTKQRVQEGDGGFYIGGTYFPAFLCVSVLSTATCSQPLPKCHFFSSCSVHNSSSPYFPWYFIFCIATQEIKFLGGELFRQHFCFLKPCLVMPCLIGQTSSPHTAQILVPTLLFYEFRQLKNEKRMHKKFHPGVLSKLFQTHPFLRKLMI